MTQSAERSLTARKLTAPEMLVLGAVWFAMTVLFGLWEVGWSFARVPGWFYAYALLAAVIAPPAVRLGTGLRPDQPYWPRVLRRGLGCGIPASLLILGRELISGEMDNPALVGLFALTWTLVSLVFGMVNDRLERSRFRDWL